MKKYFTSYSICIIIMTILVVPNKIIAQLKINRVELQKHDLSVQGREVMQVEVSIGEGETFPKHRHW
jgi:hypothetical protein